MKYGIWNVAQPKPENVNAIVGGGFSPLNAMVLASRGVQNAEGARNYLNRDCRLHDPCAMTDMAVAAVRVKMALDQGETIAVFGDYDVDGITATCLLTDFLRSMGGSVVPYIPGRLEEGYGLNEIAIRQLWNQGVSLIVTVDCGITATPEALLCKELGIDLVITDHHECKPTLPEAIAVVDPHRPDGGYPHKNLSGVGVAFKLACAICGDQQEVLDRYADMVCLGTIADVMVLQGENRTFVWQGLQKLRHTTRPGLLALMKESGCDPESLTASSVGYTLAPRINAAGRMGHIETAIELFLTDDPVRAEELAKALCDMNRQRQAVESEIYEQAIAMLPTDSVPDAIVLADERWHQGVVGIVSSRIAEQFCCPTFLICLDGDHGKASSRSYGGFNLFGSLSALQDLLESFGGHELAAGFTIHRQQIDIFRDRICELARNYYSLDTPRTVLDADCAVSAQLLTTPAVEALSALEPCGNGCPRPILVTEQMTVERLSLVGGGRHLRLQLRQNHTVMGAICFGATEKTFCIEPGDVVDVAYYPQINEFKGLKAVQMNIVDIRPACKVPVETDTSDYRAMKEQRLNADIACRLTPDRQTLGRVWRCLSAWGPEIKEDPLCLCRKIVRRTEQSLSLGVFLTCLDIFSEVGLLELRRRSKYLSIRLTDGGEKHDLTLSVTMQRLLAAKEQ